MAKEDFFKIDVDLNTIKLLLSNYILSFNDEYDEITLNFMGCLIWIYGYYEENNILYINVKYESKTDDNTISLFKRELLNKGFIDRDIT